jgi:hypothetical protein
MAGTGGEDITQEWLLFPNAIAYVARRAAAHLEAAQEFLLTEVAGRRIRHRYHGKLEFNGRVFPEEYVFVRTKHVRHEIAVDGAVVRTGPAIVRAEAEPDPSGEYKRFRPEEELYVFDLSRTVVARMPLVQLCVEDIDRRLRASGFVLPSNDPAQTELPLPLPPASEAASQKNPESEERDPRSGRLLELVQKGQLSGSRMKPITAAVFQIFPPDGRLPEDLTAAGLEALVVDLWTSQAAAKQKKKPTLPASMWHTCNRLLKRYRADI